MNFTDYTLGEALSSSNETIKRNAFSILKQLQKQRDAQLASYICPKYKEPVLPDENGMCSLCHKHSAGGQKLNETYPDLFPNK